jgi:hypothetical protein
VNWEAIGAIGEVGGAVAVIVTLVYLAKQIGQNSTIIKADMYQRHVDMRSRTNDLIASNSELNSVLYRVRSGDGVTDEDMGRYRAFMVGFFSPADNIYHQYELGALDEDELESLMGMVKSILRAYRSDRHGWVFGGD